MNQEEKLKLARQVMQIAGIFSLVVAGVLLINFMQLKKNEPLESETLNYLVEQLKDDSRNEQLMEEIRNFDLLVRKAYFTSAWQVKTGTILLLFGGILFGLSLKVYTDIRRKIGVPEKDTESFLLARSMSYKWILVSGVLIFGLALVAGFSSKNYLNEYYAMPEEHMVVAEVDETIEVVEITEGSAEKPALAEATADRGAEGGSEAAVGRIHEFSSSQSESTPTAEISTVVSEINPGIDEFKKQHNTFRGPMGLGISYHKNIPVNWDGAAGTNVIWKVALSKPGYNSPIIWGDKLFLAGADAEARIVSCYNKKTGQLLWEKKADNIAGSPATMPKVTDDTGL
ncbi:MAG: hypothetical protein PF450_08220, partial [Bacteroidales bacterium]|nr:hypothetical protein [Bacteroidales bacterium]